MGLANNFFFVNSELAKFSHIRAVLIGTEAGGTYCLCRSCT